MNKQIRNNIHWLIFGLIIVVAIFSAYALVQKFVPQAAYNGNMSITSTGESKYSGDNQDQARSKAFENATLKAGELAKLAGKSLGKITYINENQDPGQPMGAPDQMSPQVQESSSSGQAEKTMSITVTYELY